MKLLQITMVKIELVEQDKFQKSLPIHFLEIYQVGLVTNLARSDFDFSCDVEHKRGYCYDASRRHSVCSTLSISTG